VGRECFLQGVVRYGKFASVIPSCSPNPSVCRCASEPRLGSGRLRQTIFDAARHHIVASTPVAAPTSCPNVGEQFVQKLASRSVVDTGLAPVGDGYRFCRRAAPDGYPPCRLGLNASMAVNPSLFAHLPTIDRRLRAVAMLAEFPFVSVTRISRQSVKELIAMAKAIGRDQTFRRQRTGRSVGGAVQADDRQQLTHVPIAARRRPISDSISGQGRSHDNLAERLGPKGGNVAALGPSKQRSPLLPTCRRRGSGVPATLLHWFACAPKKRRSHVDKATSR